MIYTQKYRHYSFYVPPWALPFEPSGGTTTPAKNVSTPVVGHRDRKLITPPAIGERNIVVTVSVCLSVCLSASISLKLRTRPIFSKYLCALRVAASRSSSCGFAISYVLPVLWMTSYLPINGP